MLVRIKTLEELADDYGDRLYFWGFGCIGVTGETNHICSSMFKYFGDVVELHSGKYRDWHYEPWMYNKLKKPETNVTCNTNGGCKLEAFFDGRHYKVTIGGYYFGRSDLDELIAFAEKLKNELKKGE